MVTKGLAGAIKKNKKKAEGGTPKSPSTEKASGVPEGRPPKSTSTEKASRPEKTEAQRQLLEAALARGKVLPALEP